MFLSSSSAGKESTYNARDPSSIPGSAKSPGEGNSNTLQYSCLGNPMDRRAWQAAVHEVAKSQTWLSTHTQVGWDLVIQLTTLILNSPHGSWGSWVQGRKTWRLSPPGPNVELSLPSAVPQNSQQHLELSNWLSGPFPERALGYLTSYPGSTMTFDCCLLY